MLPPDMPSVSRTAGNRAREGARACACHHLLDKRGEGGNPVIQGNEVNIQVITLILLKNYAIQRIN